MASKTKLKLTLKEWIERTGVQTVKKLCQVTEGGVRHWLEGRGLPNDRMKLKIKTLSNGAVNCDEMISTFYGTKR